MGDMVTDERLAELIEQPDHIAKNRDGYVPLDTQRALRELQRLRSSGGAGAKPMAWMNREGHVSCAPGGGYDTPLYAKPPAIASDDPSQPLRSSATAGGWQPIESAPKDGREILVFSIADTFPDGEGREIQRPGCWHVAKWNPDGDSWVSEEGDINGPAHHLEVTGSWSSGCGWLQPNEVSHWMPLPAPPTGAAP